ncbi:uncharacterized protein MELLADRAFT_107349 [Melampsora larici-populina 98AG31]|uniref:Uncharacterized protein n=1 Tax=Melampsora larici-populina (strain 98AG31 / pathotype 3-4-7) TaxID=747676 RepID=F4RPH9_MELLP|nr:uncharacterized protein MELLADRAFT_107349 [Melampsora larici-populina 98AG31]EGG05718.1 hypothetical protein MELLADRAFT_107349 [Melampsora larici-populina 98AG31]
MGTPFSCLFFAISSPSDSTGLNHHLQAFKGDNISQITHFTVMNHSIPSHPLTPQAPSSAGSLNSNDTGLFPPRHIPGQCVHRWESPQHPGETVFYHQASRCEYERLRGVPPTPPNISNSIGPASASFALISPSPMPRHNIYQNVPSERVTRP